MRRHNPLRFEEPSGVAAPESARASPSHAAIAHVMTASNSARRRRRELARTARASRWPWEKSDARRRRPQRGKDAKASHESGGGRLLQFRPGFTTGQRKRI